MWWQLLYLVNRREYKQKFRFLRRLPFVSLQDVRACGWTELKNASKKIITKLVDISLADVLRIKRYFRYPSRF
jgi:hypothetical protein